MDRVAGDVRIALRGFRRTPAFFVSAVIIIGLGIGMAVAVATVFDAVLRRPLPVRDESRLAVLWTYHDPAVELTPTTEDLRTFRRETRTLRDVAGVAHWGADQLPLLDGDRSVVLGRAVVTGNFFDLLGARPALGRLLRAEDEVPGAPHVMVISHGTWRTRFGGDPAVVGRRLVDPYSRDAFTIVGVAPPGLDYPTGVGYWVPVWPGPVQLFVVGRLAPGATREAAAAELLTVVRRLAPERNLRGARALPFAEAIVGDVRPALVVLTGAVALLLLIACVNVGGLLLVRAASRARELAVRRALGASAGDIARQLAVESALLGLVGGALGLGLAAALLRGVVALAPAQLPRLDTIQLDGAPVGMALAVTLSAVLAFGVLPVLGAARRPPAATLRHDVRSGRGSRGARALRQWLVGSQVALAVVMLAAAGLLARSLARLEQVELGYATEQLSIVHTSWNATRISAWPARVRLGEAVLGRLRALPGATAVTTMLVPPFFGTNVWGARFEAEGQSAAERDAIPLIPIEVGGAEYFRTFGMPIVRGRGFLGTDDAGTTKVVVVSETVARRYWPNADPIGQRLRIPPIPSVRPPDGDNDWRAVIGVVRDTRLRSLRQATPTVYLPWQQLEAWQGSFALRSTGDPATLARAVQRAVREVDPEIDAYSVRTMNDLLGEPLAQPRLTTLLLSGFSLVALLLAAVGLYGAVSSVVGEQTRELGVRAALGATPGRLRRDVLHRALAVAAAGAVAGVVGALAASRLLTALLYEVSPTDPAALIGACALLLAVAALAAYLPARRATAADPAHVLRAE